MATEAQKLMVMSLGKIQGCRKQRGGINLYKSLLVTKVLYRARSVALSESSVDKENEEHEQQHKEEEEDQRVPEMDTSSSSDNVIGDDSAFAEEGEETKDGYDDDNCCSVEEDKENSNVPSQRLSCDNSKVLQDCENTSRSRVKRRRTEVEEAVDSISCKKQRCDYEEYQPIKTTEEAMQTEPITSLVSSFNTGFTGLLATENENTNSQCEENSSESHKLSPESSSLLSCSTQIKESFELLARPIALSV